MDELTAFVKARLDEDEAVAMNAQNILSGRWDIDTDGNVQDEDTGGGGSAYIACGPYGGGVDEADAIHITRHDPARVLREVAAKRAILAEHSAVTRLAGLTEQELGFLGRYREWLLKNLAAVWSDRPDYPLSASRDAPEVPSGTANRTLALVNTLRDQLIGN
jgi:hypothetical protein